MNWSSARSLYNLLGSQPNNIRLFWLRRDYDAAGPAVLGSLTIIPGGIQIQDPDQALFVQWTMWTMSDRDTDCLRLPPPPVTSRRWRNAVLVLAQRLRRWANTNTALSCCKLCQTSLIIDGVFSVCELQQRDKSSRQDKLSPINTRSSCNVVLMLG